MRWRVMGRRWWPVLLAATGCAAITILVATRTFPDGSANLDEVAYVAQGRALVSGQLTLPAAETLPSFRPYLSGTLDDEVVFKYQPLWPALIGVADAVVDATVALRALLSFAGVLAAAWFAFELLGSRRAAIAAAVLFAATPFVWLQSATLLGYHPSLVLLLATAAAFVRAASTGSGGAAIAAGALLGASVTHRPFDAVLTSIPVVIYAVLRVERGSRRRLIGCAALGVVPFAVVVLAYNTAVTGSPLTFPFNLSGGIDTFGFGWRSSVVIEGYGHDYEVHYTPRVAVETAGESLGALWPFLVAAPALLAADVTAVWLRRRDGRTWLLVAMAATTVVGYGFWWGTANLLRFGLQDAMGPVYHYPLLIPLLTLAAWAIDLLWDRRWIWLVAIGAAGVLVGAPATLDALDHAGDQGAARAQEVASFQGVPPRVAIAPPGYPGDPYVRWANDADLVDDQLVATDVPGERPTLVERFSDRAVVLLVEYHELGDPFGPTRRVEVPLDVVSGAAVRVTVRPGQTETAGRFAYLRIGDDVHLADGPEGTWTVTAADLADRERIDVGLVTPVDGEVPLDLRTERLDCRLPVAVRDEQMTVVTPCDWWHHYDFPGDLETDAPEDLHDLVEVEVTVAEEP